MKNNIKAQKFRFTEHIKTAILIGLLACMLVLMVVYIGGTHVYENVAYDVSIGESFERLWSVQDTGEQMGLDGNNLIPEFIVYKQKTAEYPMGSVASESSLKELYGLVKPCLLELFGNDSICRRLPAEQGRELFVSAQSGDEFVYIRYHVPVLYQLIYAYAANRLTVSEGDIASGYEENVGAYIGDIIIIPDNEFAAHRFIAYATDLNGNYYEFRPDDHFVASEFYISRLADIGSVTYIHRFEFVNMGKDNILQPLPDSEIETDFLEYIPTVIGNNHIKNSVLKLFGYNPDNLNFYSDGDEIVYIDSSSKLRIGNELISFVVNDASNDRRGIDIGSLLGYVSEDTYSLLDKITAVDNLIRKIKDISPVLVGGEEVSLCLGEVYTNNSLLVIEYFLTYDSIKIERAPVLRVLLTENSVCEIELNFAHIRAKGLSNFSSRPKYILRKLYELGKIPDDEAPVSMGLRYEGADASWNVFLG